MAMMFRVKRPRELHRANHRGTKIQFKALEFLLEPTNDHRCDALAGLQRHVADETVTHHDIHGAFEDIVAFHVALEIQIARLGSRAQQLARLFDDFIALNDFLANIEQPHAGGGVLLEHGHQCCAHHSELQQVLGRAINVGPQIEHRGGAPLVIGHLGCNRRAVDTIQRFQQVARNGHQRARIPRRHSCRSRAILDLLNGHAHGGILLPAQRHFHGIVHADDLAGRDHGRAFVRERFQTLWLPHEQQMGVGMGIEKLAARRQRDAGAVVAPHAVNCQGDHGWPGNLPMQRSKQRPVLHISVATGLGRAENRSGFGLVLQHLTATVHAVGADVVAQMRFTGGGLHGDARHRQGIVRTVHAALGRRLFVLLNSHDGSWVLKGW